MSKKSESFRITTIIFDRLVAGETITSICADTDVPVGLTAVMGWLNPKNPKYDPEFADLYKQAREIQAQVMLDECIDIADDRAGDYYTTYKTKGGKRKRKRVLDPEAVQRASLRINTRMKYLEKTNPYKYGHRVNSAVQNPDGSPLQLLEQIAASGTSRTQDIVAGREEEES